MKTANSAVRIARPVLVRGGLAAALMVSLLAAATPALAGERRILRNPVPETVAHLQLLARLAATNRLQFAIGLPLRNRDTLTNLVQQIYDPRSANFHRYLTPEQFTEQFGPTDPQYQSVMDYAKSNRLEVVHTFANRGLVDVAGSVADIERMFQVHLGTYQHPTENRQFYAPDVEPSVDAGLPILYVSGLDNYAIPRSGVRKADALKRPKPMIKNGSGSGGWYLGSDFRNAYVPGVTALQGAGQVVALFEMDGYTPGDITKYEGLARLPNVPLQAIMVPPGPLFSPGVQNAEVTLDIEMVISMAPGLKEVLIVEGNDPPSIMNELAYPPPGSGVPLANQISSSFGLSSETNIEPQLIEMAVQGQTFFRHSGDAGAPAGGIGTDFSDFNYLTLCGGTELSMSNNGASWASEASWQHSTGEIDPKIAIPEYQKGMNMSANHGSTLYHNSPDVAMCADWIEVVDTTTDAKGNYTVTGNVEALAGTSAAAPLWAGFTALVNEQAAAQGKPTVGFLNPAIYAIGKGPLYTSCFHDITVGNNTNVNSDDLFFAVPGYDLCTGWGSPNGQNLIDALVGFAGPVFVDFNYTGTTQDGSYNHPFKTLAHGVNAVRTGGPIFIKTAGSSSETMTISKAMSINANGGAATVGVGH